MKLAASQRTIAMGAGALLLYLILVGGTTWGEIHLAPRFVNALIGGALLVAYVLRAREADRIDALVLLAVGLFGIAAALSDYPRQSLDALLAALCYAAGLFIARRLMVDRTMRRAVLITMMVLSFGLVVLTVSRWAVVVEWWALAGWSVTPPLNMELDATPWGHRHDLALLVTMLYPAWWVGRRSPVRTVLAVVIGVLTAYIVLVDGSRTLWLAVVFATATLGAGAALRAVRGRPRAALAVIGSVAAVSVAVLLVGGPARALVERALTTDTLVARKEMWQPLLDDWMRDPVAGLGPATFPFALQHTDYFTQHAWAPRHPDNVIVQALVEGGVLGVAAVAVVLVALVPAVLRSRSAAARWALVAFTVAGIGASPTDFAFLVVIAITWTAYAIPASSPDRERRRSGIVTGGSLVALVLIFVGYSSAVVGATLYEAARASVRSGELEAARAQATAASAFDPSLALYSRTEGVIRLAMGDADAATDALQRATDLAPADDQAWRALALAHAEMGERQLAAEALERALAAQRSDPVNLLLAAASAQDGDARRELIAEIVQGWPFVLVAPNWSDFAQLSTDHAISSAVERWRATPDSLDREIYQAVVLVTWAERDDLLDEAIAAGSLDRDLALAYRAAASCDPAASALLDEIPTASRRNPVYWSLRLRLAAGDVDEQARYRRMYEVMTGRPVSDRVGSGTLSPFDTRDLAGFSLAEWGYRRPPFPTLGWREPLPSPNTGRALWILGEPGPGCSN